MTWAIVIAIIGFGIACFVVGALVYRNNSKRLEKKLAEAEKIIADLKAKIPK